VYFDIGRVVVLYSVVLFWVITYTYRLSYVLAHIKNNINHPSVNCK